MSWPERDPYVFASSVPASSAYHELTPTLSVGISAFNQPSLVAITDKNPTPGGPETSWP